MVTVTFVRTWNLVPRRDKSSVVKLARRVLMEGVLYFLSVYVYMAVEIYSQDLVFIVELCC